MKIVICGKGGSGKSTISALIAKGLKNKGYKVLLVDADESNMGLHRLMGISMPMDLLENIGGKKNLQEKLTQAFTQKNSMALFDGKWKIQDIPKDCVAEADGIKLMIIGKIHEFGAGCACPMGAISRIFLSNLDTEDDEAVIVDTEAGVEHFGRGVDAGCDLALGVIDPAYESFLLADKMQEMAKKAEIEIFFVLNKVEGQVKDAMAKHIDPKKVIAEIPKNDTIFMDSLEGKELKTDLPEINQICQFIEDFKKK